MKLARIALLALPLAACGQAHTGPDSGDPREAHVLAETSRFAALLSVHVHALVTDEVYLVPASKPLYPGEQVPAAGWYNDGQIKYWRPNLLERDLAYGSALAAHETCHALHHDEAGADSCAAELLK